MFNNDELIMGAYQLYHEKRNTEIEDRALNTLNNFHEAVNKWNPDINNLGGLRFYLNYLVGNEMEAISSSGVALAKHDNLRLIMKKKSTALKVSELFSIRKNNMMNEGITGKIADVKIIYHVLNHPESVGNKPNIYIQRFLLSIFVEIMTTIADDKQLRNTAKLLGKNPKGVSFERLQVQVRSTVEDSLKRLKVGDELSKFSRAAIAYYIVEASKNNYHRLQAKKVINIE